MGAFEFNSSFNGIYKEKQSTTSVSVYPNPFQSETVIYFNKQLENSCVKIYSAEGREVKIIQQRCGREIIVDARGLNDGTYFYRVSQNDQIFAAGKFIVERTN